MDPSNGRILWSHAHDRQRPQLRDAAFGRQHLFVSPRIAPEPRDQLSQEGSVTQPMNCVLPTACVSCSNGSVSGNSSTAPRRFRAGVPDRARSQTQAMGNIAASAVPASSTDSKASPDEDGDLALAKLAPECVTSVETKKVFDTVSWTVPTWSAGRYMRAIAKDRGAQSGSQ